MNNTRRKAIKKLMGALADLRDQIEFIRDEEQDAYDNLPESLQESDRGEAMSTAVCNLEDAMEDLDLAIDALEEAQQ